ncbi:MAG: hypothetical protein ABIL58_27120 [Pseudomonadota bacterium]
MSKADDGQQWLKSVLEEIVALLWILVAVALFFLALHFQSVIASVLAGALAVYGGLNLRLAWALAKKPPEATDES